MSNLVSEVFIKQYSDTIQHLSQQKGSRLAKAVRNETQSANLKFYDRLGAASAQLKTSQHMDTPQLNSAHSRRGVAMDSYVWADLLDSSDKIRLGVDPTADYVKSAVMALGRKKDDAIIAAISGTALTGVDGAGSQTLGNAQKLASVSGGAGANLNVQALRRAARILNAADVDPEIPRYIAVNASALESLLSQTEATSSDFNTVKALVQGQIDTFLGFKFILSNRLVTQSSSLSFNQTSGAVGSGSGDSNGYYKILCWAQDGVILSTGMEIKTRVSERADKNYSMQVFAEADFGAVRMEEAKVVEIHCAQ